MRTQPPYSPQPILYFASANPGKLREFQSAARPFGFEVRALPGLSQLPPCIEDDVTFQGNAIKKALYYSTHTTEMVFADDSGICVDALNGAPGVYSARFAGPHATDEENNKKLLQMLRKVEARPGHRPARAAHYVCVIALAQQGVVLRLVEGRADGVIIDAPQGSGGFGYDPYFFFPPLGKTFAELTAEEKFSVSHRGAAFRALLQGLSAGRPSSG